MEQQSKICTKCNELKDISLFAKDKRISSGYISRCASCTRIDATLRMKKWRSKNPEKDKENNDNWARKNPEKRAISQQKYHAKNAEKNRKANSEYRRKNPHVWTAKSTKRHLAKKQAVPAWADFEKIKEFYRLATELTKSTGIRHEVDHIVPIQGKNVCGFHSQHNLRVIPWHENRQKSNKLTQQDY